MANLGFAFGSRLDPDRSKTGHRIVIGTLGNGSQHDAGGLITVLSCCATGPCPARPPMAPSCHSVSVQLGLSGPLLLRHGQTRSWRVVPKCIGVHEAAVLPLVAMRAKFPPLFTADVDVIAVCRSLALPIGAAVRRSGTQSVPGVHALPLSVDPAVLSSVRDNPSVAIGRMHRRRRQGRRHRRAEQHRCDKGLLNRHNLLSFTENRVAPCSSRR